MFDKAHAATQSALNILSQLGRCIDQHHCDLRVALKRHQHQHIVACIIQQVQLDTDQRASSRRHCPHQRRAVHLAPAVHRSPGLITRIASAVSSSSASSSCCR